MHFYKWGVVKKLFTGGFTCLSNKMHYYMVVSFNLLNYETNQSLLISLYLTLICLFSNATLFWQMKQQVCICLLCYSHTAAENWSFEFRWHHNASQYKVLTWYWLSFKQVWHGLTENSAVETRRNRISVFTIHLKSVLTAPSYWMAKQS